MTEESQIAGSSQEAKKEIPQEDILRENLKSSVDSGAGDKSDTAAGTGDSDTSDMSSFGRLIDNRWTERSDWQVIYATGILGISQLERISGWLDIINVRNVRAHVIPISEGFGLTFTDNKERHKLRDVVVDDLGAHHLMIDQFNSRNEKPPKLNPVIVCSARRIIEARLESIDLLKQQNRKFSSEDARARCAVAMARNTLTAQGNRALNRWYVDMAMPDISTLRENTRMIHRQRIYFGDGHLHHGETRLIGKRFYAVLPERRKSENGDRLVPLFSADEINTTRHFMGMKSRVEQDIFFKMIEWRMVNQAEINRFQEEHPILSDYLKNYAGQSIFVRSLQSAIARGTAMNDKQIASLQDYVSGTGHADFVRVKEAVPGNAERQMVRIEDAGGTRYIEDRRHENLVGGIKHPKTDPRKPNIRVLSIYAFENNNFVDPKGADSFVEGKNRVITRDHTGQIFFSLPIREKKTIGGPKPSNATAEDPKILDGPTPA